MKTIRNVLSDAVTKLKFYDIQQAGLDAQVLLSELLKKDRLFLHAHHDELLTEDIISIYQSQIDRRCKNEPIAYITGHKEFMSLDFIVNEHVLIPRADTETLAEYAIKEAKARQHPRILDLCCGSGCIGISIAHYVPEAIVTLADISEPALDISIINIKKHDLSKHVHAVQTDLFQNLDGDMFDLIVSNPPYISDQEWSSIEHNVKNFEPHLALRAELDGLAFYQQIINDASKHLNQQGVLAFEIGYDQAEQVSRFMSERYQNVSVIKDLSRNDRVVYGSIEK